MLDWKQLFGNHLILDFRSELDLEVLSDPLYMENFILKISEELNMELVTKPYVFTFPVPDSSILGLSGIGIWASSHISIHTYPEVAGVSIDAYACSTFNKDIALDVINEYYKPLTGCGIFLKRHFHNFLVDKVIHYL